MEPGDIVKDIPPHVKIISLMNDAVILANG